MMKIDMEIQNFNLFIHSSLFNKAPSTLITVINFRVYKYVEHLDSRDLFNSAMPV